MADTTGTTAHNDAAIEVDDQAVRADSTYGDELSSFTASLTSSVLNYRKENGRRYHGYRDGNYLMPNDQDEAERLDMMHEMSLTAMSQKLFLAPIGDTPRRVIDLGTGTGIWAIDFADQHPSAVVTGVDLSPIQPSMVPLNVKFLIDDIEQEWIYEEPFDFIHARFLATSVKDYRKVLKQAYNNTVPGGWVEIQDWDTMLQSEDGSTEGTSIEQYYSAVVGAYEKVGYTARPGPYLEEWFREAGFEEVHVQKYPVPLGAWPKDPHLKNLGLWNLVQTDTGFEAWAMAVLTRFEGWSKDEVTVLVAKTRRDARNLDIHSVFYFYVVYGRKPQNSE